MTNHEQIVKMIAYLRQYRKDFAKMPLAKRKVIARKNLTAIGVIKATND